jgi:hypothetical protein
VNRNSEVSAFTGAQQILEKYFASSGGSCALFPQPFPHELEVLLNALKVQLQLEGTKLPPLPGMLPRF